MKDYFRLFSVDTENEKEEEKLEAIKDYYMIDNKLNHVYDLGTFKMHDFCVLVTDAEMVKEKVMTLNLNRGWKIFHLDEMKMMIGKEES